MSMTAYSTTRRWWGALPALLVVIVAATACSGGSIGGHEPSAANALGLPDLTDRAVDVTAPVLIDPPAPPAPTARAAIEQFTRAEIAGDTTGSYGLLVAADRVAVRGRIGWHASHARMPALVAFDVEEVAITADGADVRGDARFSPRIDEVGGLVPGQAELVWRVLPEEGGWRVAYERTQIVPRYPSDAGAADAVATWVRARQACTTPAAELEYDAGLVGVPALAPALCGTTGLALGAAAPLGDRPDPSAVIAAFGPDADRWARVVRIASPVAMNAVVAPLGDHWIVIGLLADPR
jgi:hypothetical protein